MSHRSTHVAGRRETAGRRARDRELAEILGMHRMSMFVPAVMSVGIVFWALSELRDLLWSRRVREQDKFAQLASRRVGDRITGSTPRPSEAVRSMRPRPVYLCLAVALHGAAIGVAFVGVAGYRGDPGALAMNGSMLTLLLAAATVASLYGAACLAAFASYPAPHWRASRILDASPLTVPATPGADAEGRPSRWLGGAVVAASCGAVLSTVLVTWSPGAVQTLDRAGSRRLAHRPGADILTWLDPVGRTGVAVVVAALAAIFAMRCRVLVSGYVASLVAVLAISAILPHLVGHPRPVGGPFTGRSEAFPSAHLIHSTVMAGLVPLVLAVVLRTRAVVRPFRALLAIGVVATGIDRTGSKLHWPSDVVGGVLFGTALVLAVDWLLANRRSHANCRGCPWSSGAHHVHPARAAWRARPVRVRWSARGVARLVASAATLAVTTIVLIERGPLVSASVSVVLLVPTVAVLLSRGGRAGPRSRARSCADRPRTTP